ncbi:YchJ family metal-binding protein [Pontiellaceae bacterium B12227]|nr:YchJ family metal-binding protein [Pontiellaceae bacterium B12227]
MNSTSCPCGSGELFVECCGPLISGKEKAHTAEQLMRSRYSAYVKHDVDYLVSTTHPKSRTSDLAQSIASWMNQVQWIRLHVLNAEKETVEFIAEYISDGKPAQHHERSLFKKHKGEWFYVGEA